MANRNSTNRNNNWWERADLKVGVIGSLVAIFFAFFSPIKSCKKENLETRELEQRLNEAEARLEIAYVNISGDMYSLSRSGDPALDKKQHFFLDYPIIDNEINYGTDSLNSTNPEGFEKHTIYLMVENKGKSPANNIEVIVNRLVLDKVLPIVEGGPQQHDYENELRATAVQHTADSIKIPLNLETGQGILIPIMIADCPAKYRGPSKEWSIVSKTAYLPQLIRYKSPVSNKIITNKIRKMYNPLRLSDGVEIRG